METPSGTASVTEDSVAGDSVSEELSQLNPVRVTGGEAAEAADYPMEFDGVIGGASVSEFLPSTSAGFSSPPTTSNAAGDSARDDDYEAMLQRFMRNEIGYDEFMRRAGGMSLDDEEAAAGSEDDEELDEGDLDEGPRKKSRRTSQGESSEDVEEVGAGGGGMLSSRHKDLPSAVRLMMREVIKEDIIVHRPGVEVPAAGLPAQVKESPSKEPQHVRQSRKLNKALDALLGQANLIHARGDTREAISMLLEVIRQEPRNADAYRQVSEIYQDLGDAQKSLQYGLLAAYLDGKTPASDWDHLGDLAERLHCSEEAAACYGRAMRSEPTNWRFYEKRINVLEKVDMKQLAMRTRLQAIQTIDPKASSLDFDWFHALIRTVAEYYINFNDEEKAIQTLDAFIIRSKQFGRPAEAQHEMLLGMWIARGKHAEAAKSILSLCDDHVKLHRKDGKPAIKISIQGTFYNVMPFPPPIGSTIQVSDDLPTTMLCKLLVCFIMLKQKDITKELTDLVLSRCLTAIQLVPDLVDVAKAFYDVDWFAAGRRFCESMHALPQMYDEANLWFVYGNLLMALRENELAIQAFERVITLDPSHVDGRINLSGLLQNAGQSDRALEILQGSDLEGASHLPDERLLVRQADFLFERGQTEHFVRCCRMLLTPYFYEIHRSPEIVAKKRVGKQGAVFALSTTLRMAALHAIEGTTLEKFVRRLGSVAYHEQQRCGDEMDAAALHDYCLKLVESLLKMGRLQDMLTVCCYAFLQPKITKHEKSCTFQNLLYYCAVRAQNWSLAFECARWLHQSALSCNALMLPENKQTIFKRIFNAMNFVFCHSQNVSYHRYVMRALAKNPGNHALQAISGNNSLITGTYRHALGEFLRVWVENKNNPLICLLIGLTFTHMACKKDLSSRHMIAIRGLAFLRRYELTRSVRQEVFYNLARTFHQMSITPLAIHFYEKTLAEPPPCVAETNENGDEVTLPAERYDLKRVAAHNLALLYRSSGNDCLALSIYEKYLVI